MDGLEPPPPYSPMGSADAVQSTIDRPSVPFIGPIPRLVDGSMVILQGIIPSKAKSFKVTLSCGPALCGAVDAAFVVSPDQMDEKSGPVLLRNAFIGNKWGKEEKWGLNVPCKPGFQIEMLILATKEDFKVALNGQHYCEFKHRMPMERVSHLVVEGDVILNFIRHQNPHSASASASAPPPPTNSTAPPAAPTKEKTVTSQTTTVYQTQPVTVVEPVPVVVPMLGHHHHHLLPHLLPHHRRHHGFGFGRHHGFGHRRF